MSNFGLSTTKARVAFESNILLASPSNVRHSLQHSLYTNLDLTKSHPVLAKSPVVMPAARKTSSSAIIQFHQSIKQQPSAHAKHKIKCVSKSLDVSNSYKTSYQKP